MAVGILFGSYSLLPSNNLAWDLTEIMFCHLLFGMKKVSLYFQREGKARGSYCILFCLTSEPSDAITCTHNWDSVPSFCCSFQTKRSCSVGSTFWQSRGSFMPGDVTSLLVSPPLPLVQTLISCRYY